MADDKTFTQAEMDSIIEGRLARERQKYADYDDLKEKAGKYDEYQAQNKTELQKEKEKSDALQAKERHCETGKRKNSKRHWCTGRITDRGR